MDKINQPHCQACGNTDPYDLDTGRDEDLQGYTRCCNERVVLGFECGGPNGGCYHSNARAT